MQSRLIGVVFCVTILLGVLWDSGVQAQPGPPPPPPGGPLPPPPVPPTNPITPAKTILGKILFWDEQLSSDDSVSCGTCHIPEFGGSDPRSFTSAHPGPNSTFGNGDDIFGSPGMIAQDCGGTRLEDPLFGFERQVTRRKSPTMIMAAYAPTLFWDGRAEGTFVDPENGVILINNGGALEAQSVEPILSSVEMACETRTWDDVRQKLITSTPLALATDLTPDIVAALAVSPDYSALFAAAFGTADITAARIGFALATYQRTLISNQSPFDEFLAIGPAALTSQENQGRQLFAQNCLPCHAGALQTDHNFRRIGVRPVQDDLGRGAITNFGPDNGDFKTPTLRNVALRAPYFHNGGKADLQEVLQFYNAGGDFPNPGLPPNGTNLNPQERDAVIAFLETLTDPRVAAALSPFDHPTLQTYLRRGDANQDEVFDVSDPILVLEHLFGGPVSLTCEDAADANDDGVIDVADVMRGLDRLFGGGMPLPLPSERSLGPDPTADSLGCS